MSPPVRIVPTALSTFLVAAVLATAAPAAAAANPARGSGRTSNPAAAAAVSVRSGAADVPTPESVLGFPVGADFQLASYEQSLAYFRALEAASDRVRLVEVGRTSNGRPWYVALISSPENLAAAERYREISQRLAHPRDLDEAEARRLAREGRAIVHIDGGLHASETAHAQHTIQLAYLLAAADGDPQLQAILDNVILLLWPSINPDGQEMIVNWYRGNLGTPYEIAPMPRLYQKYVGHDNNRDGYMLNMIESRVITRVDRQWEPQILYNHHQSAPTPATIWIPPFAEPISPYVHPLMWRTVNLIGMAMAHALEEHGLRGATHMGTGFDDWYPGFLDHANNFHNIAAFLTETGQHPYATPRFYTLRDFPPRARDLRPRSMYASPWLGGWWRLRDSVQYMLTASLAVLDFAAKYRTDLLYNRYQAGRDVIRTHREDPPYAYFVPQQQRDPVAAVEMLRRLAFNGVQVYRLTADVEYEQQPFAAGTWVIPMDQEFANYVRQLFAVQEYPDLREYPEGPPEQPYDVAGWTLPYQMDVRVVEGHTPLPEPLRRAMVPVRGETVGWDGAGASFDTPPDAGYDTHPVAAGIVPPPGRAGGSGPALLLDPAQNNTYRALNRAWSAGAEVRFDPGRPGDKGEPGSSGRYVVIGLGEAAERQLLQQLALRAERGRPAGTPIRRPRIGVYHPWVASMDEGWTRWLLDVYEFAYREVTNAEVVAGALRERYDVLFVADMRPQTILEGYPQGTIPARYAGGIGRQGVRALDEFVRAGGTLVCLNNAARFAIEQLHLPVKDVVADLERDEFYVSGSIIAAEVDPSQPVMSGMPAEAKLFVGQGPVLSVLEEFEGAALAKYPAAGDLLLSGYLLGEEHMRGYAAALDVRHGDGHVLLFGFRPQWRGQPFGTFKVLFNALLYSADLAALTPANEEFWEPPAEPDKEGSEEAEQGEHHDRGC